MGCFSPPDLGRIALSFKVSMTFGFTKPEHLAVVDEHHAVAWEMVRREIALLYSMLDTRRGPPPRAPKTSGLLTVLPTFLCLFNHLLIYLFWLKTDYS